MKELDARDLLLENYYFDLPADRIAQHPAERRDGSRLLTLREDGGVREGGFSDLPDLLNPGDVLVRNDARVLPARLIGRRAGGGATELLLVRREDGDDGETWLCLARPASHLKPGKTVAFGDGELTARIARKEAEGRVWAVFSETGQAFRDTIERLGLMPLPPYIQRPGRMPTAGDRERYQTSYAKKEGAVAAPTAGLHFTPELDRRLLDKGVEIREITLYVGPGTFRPIKAENLSDHRMDAERYEIPMETWRSVTEAKRRGRRVVAVGTTSARSLESAALALAEGKSEAMALNAWTDLFIRPGFGFRAVDGMVTNFHLPGSSLIVMLAALVGRERILSAYRLAIRNGYRFYSYGDAMLAFKQAGG